MAEVVETEKGFKVIHTSRTECLKWGGIGICDHCNESPQHGYYVAVLNFWLCPDCYDRWIKNAKRYPEDNAVENMNFRYYKSLLGL